MCRCFPYQVLWPNLNYIRWNDCTSKTCYKLKKKEVPAFVFCLCFLKSTLIYTLYIAFGLIFLLPAKTVPTFDYWFLLWWFYHVTPCLFWLKYKWNFLWWSVHFIYWGVTGYNFKKILYSFLWRLIFADTAWWNDTVYIRHFIPVFTVCNLILGFCCWVVYYFDMCLTC